MESDHALYLFCGRKCDRIKAILKEHRRCISFCKTLNSLRVTVSLSDTWIGDSIIGCSTFRVHTYILTPLRTKEKLDDDTVKNDIYSILRFSRFLILKNISSFTDVSANTLVAFNHHDEHLSAEGKNSCNARIRRFLRYLYREKIIPNPNIGQVLGYSAVRSRKHYYCSWA